MFYTHMLACMCVRYTLWPVVGVKILISLPISEVELLLCLWKLLTPFYCVWEHRMVQLIMYVINAFMFVFAEQMFELCMISKLMLN